MNEAILDLAREGHALSFPEDVSKDLGDMAMGLHQLGAGGEMHLSHLSSFSQEALTEGQAERFYFIDLALKEYAEGRGDVFVETLFEITEKLFSTHLSDEWKTYILGRSTSTDIDEDMDEKTKNMIHFFVFWRDPKNSIPMLRAAALIANKGILDCRLESQNIDIFKSINNVFEKLISGSRGKQEIDPKNWNISGENVKHKQAGASYNLQTDQFWPIHYYDAQKNEQMVIGNIVRTPGGTDFVSPESCFSMTDEAIEGAPLGDLYCGLLSEKQRGSIKKNAERYQVEGVVQNFASIIRPLCKSGNVSPKGLAEHLKKILNQ